MKSSALKSLGNFLGWTIIAVLAVVNTARINMIYGILTALIIVLVFLYSKRSVFMFIKGQGLFNSGNKEEAFKWFERAYKSGLKPRNALYWAYLVLRDGDLSKSEKLIDEIVRYHKKELERNDLVNAAINRALICWKKGDLEGAIERAEEIYNSGVKTTALYGILGYWYMLSGDNEKALKINEEAYEYNSSDQIICDNLAQNYFLSGNKEKAEKMYKKLLSENPNFIEPYYNYAMILKSNGDLSGAKENFEKALTFDEKFLSTVTHDMVKKELDTVNGGFKEQ